MATFDLIPPALENRHGRAAGRLLKKYAKPVEITTDVTVTTGGHTLPHTYHRDQTEALIIRESSTLRFADAGFWETHEAVAWITGDVPIYSVDQAENGGLEFTLDEADLEQIEANDDGIADWQTELDHLLGETASFEGSVISHAVTDPTTTHTDAGVVDAGFEQRVDGTTREPSGLVRVDL